MWKMVRRNPKENTRSQVCNSQAMWNYAKKKCLCFLAITPELLGIAKRLARSNDLLFIYIQHTTMYLVWWWNFSDTISWSALNGKQQNWTAQTKGKIPLFPYPKPRRNALSYSWKHTQKLSSLFSYSNIIRTSHFFSGRVSNDINML